MATTPTNPGALVPSGNSPAGTSGTTSSQAPSSTIRNISQTVQEREIIKTAPDLLVYFEGLPYMVNYFIQDQTTGNEFTLVTHNDYVTSFNASYDTDNLVPSCAIQLQVPNYQKHLFQMPGGNNLIQTMMQVQVFAKGYYFGNDGSTLLRRVFKGIVSHVAYSDDGKMLQISVQCQGVMHLMELMQVDLSPAVISNSPLPVVPFKTQLAMCNPYLMLLTMFVRAISTEGFYINQVGAGGQSGVIRSSGDPYHESVTQGYMAKWQQILQGLQQDVHIYGLTYKDKPSTKGNIVPSPVQNQVDKNTQTAAFDQYNAKTEAGQVSDFAIAKDTNGNTFPAIRQYLPDMEVSGIQLLNGKIINRLDEIRQVTRMILYEAYQDIDGKIIFKPPLYNLDVTNVGTETTTVPSANSGSQPAPPTTTGSNTSQQSTVSQNPATEINNNNNPFIIYLAEILSEQETEDQAAIRTTRMTVQGNWEPTFQFGGQQNLLETVEYIDIPKLQKFGLREEPTRPVGWFRDGDKFGLFAYAASETVRNNRGYRTYTVTIPLRPELKLGFPCFIPHRDLYGYIKSISISYNQGGQATMSVLLDTLRRRPLLPTQQPVKNADGTTSNKQIFTSQPNLVWHWSSPPPPPTTGQAPVQTASYTNQTQAQTTYGFDAGTNDFYSFGGTSSTTNNQPLIYPNSNDSPASIVGAPATLPTTPDQQPSPQEQILNALNKGQLGSSWATEPDNKGANFFIQKDNYYSWTPPTSKGGQGTYPSGTNSNGGVFWGKAAGFSRIVDQAYYHDIRRTMPFTDDKGYEVVTPFPWGRWISLRQAVKEFTQDGYIVKPVAGQATPDIYTPSDSVQALITAGLATPNVQGDTVTQLQTLMNTESAAIGDHTIIVLSYSGTTPSDKQLTTNAQPDVAAAQKQLTGSITTTQQAIDVLVSGNLAPTKATLEAVQESYTPSPTEGITLTDNPTGPADDLYPPYNDDGTV